MTEKVLGFKEKDAIGVQGRTKGFYILKSKLVHVVSIEWLEKWINELEIIKMHYDYDFVVALDKLLLAAKKESERK